MAIDIGSGNTFKRLLQFEHTVFYGPTFAFGQSELHRRIFFNWQNFWEQHFTETNSSSKLFSDDLTRATYLLVIHRGSQPAGILLSSRWNLANSVHLASRYLTQYSATARESFLAMNFRNILSLEYLWIDPAWSFRQTQVSLSEIMLGLGLKIFRRSRDLEGVISIARRAVKVHERMAGWGMRELENMTLHNNECTVTTCTHEQLFESNADTQINHITNHFLERQVLRGYGDTASFSESLEKKAA